jgi:single-stranded-DNA-specific exonuclease
MKKVVKRILTAIEKNEKILVFSDYDTDGIPGGVLLHDFFKQIKYKNFRNFIPNRNLDGYGLTEKASKKIVNGEIIENEKFKPSLVITVDCGISDFASGEILKKDKVDLIVTDHHIAEKKIPHAVGVLNHKVKGEKYPEQILCGAGVAFKLVQALILEIQKNKKLKIEIKEGWEK